MVDAGFTFLPPIGFEWDDEKSQTNLVKHGISFDDASEVFYGPVVITGSSRNNEERWLAIGKSHDRIVSVIFTRRNDLIRIISAVRDEMKKEYIVTRRWGDRRKGKTDWVRFDAITDEEVEKSIANDPDWAEFKDIDSSDAVLVIPARKKAISIRVDEDVLDFFKNEGDGYQRRINAVLRSYMQQKTKPKKRA